MPGFDESREPIGGSSRGDGDGVADSGGHVDVVRDPIEGVKNFLDGLSLGYAGVEALHAEERSLLTGAIAESALRFVINGGEASAPGSLIAVVNGQEGYIARGDGIPYLDGIRLIQPEDAVADALTRALVGGVFDVLMSGDNTKYGEDYLGLDQEAVQYAVVDRFRTDYNDMERRGVIELVSDDGGGFTTAFIDPELVAGFYFAKREAIKQSASSAITPSRG
jgi:hypothetical protein